MMRSADGRVKVDSRLVSAALGHATLNGKPLYANYEMHFVHFVGMEVTWK